MSEVKVTPKKCAKIWMEDAEVCREYYKTDKAISFSNEINGSVIGDFEKSGDKMCHVSTFCYADEKIFVSYYANTSSDKENPNFQTARLAYAPVKAMNEKTIMLFEALEPLYNFDAKDSQ